MATSRRCACFGAGATPRPRPRAQAAVFGLGFAASRGAGAAAAAIMRRAHRGLGLLASGASSSARLRPLPAGGRCSSSRARRSSSRALRSASSALRRASSSALRRASSARLPRLFFLDLLALGLDRRLALGDLGSELLADLVDVGLDQRGGVVLGRDLERLRAVRAAPCSSSRTPWRVRELSCSAYLYRHSPCCEPCVVRTSSKSRFSRV